MGTRIRDKLTEAPKPPTLAESYAADTAQLEELDKKENDPKLLKPFKRQIEAAEQDLKDLRAEKRDAAKSNAIQQALETFTNAAGQYAAGSYGLKTGTDMSGVQFSKTDWSARLRSTLDSLQDQIKDARGEASEGTTGMAASRDALAKERADTLKRMGMTATEIAKTQTKATESEAERKFRERQQSESIKAADTRQTKTIGSQEKRAKEESDAKVQQQLMDIRAAERKFWDSKKAKEEAAAVANSAKIELKGIDQVNKEALAKLKAGEKLSIIEQKAVKDNNAALAKRNQAIDAGLAMATNIDEGNFSDRSSEEAELGKLNLQLSKVGVPAVTDVTDAIKALKELKAAAPAIVPLEAVAPPPSSSEGMVKMILPSGTEKMIPAASVEAAKTKGAKVAE